MENISGNHSAVVKAIPAAPDTSGKAFSDVAHGLLTAGSFAPSVFGSAASIADGALHAIEGNKTEAVMCLAAAGIGLFGAAGLAKVAMKGAQAVLKVGEAGKASTSVAKAASEVAANSSQVVGVVEKGTTVATANATGEVSKAMVVIKAEPQLATAVSKTAPDVVSAGSTSSAHANIVSAPKAVTTKVAEKTVSNGEMAMEVSANHSAQVLELADKISAKSRMPMEKAIDIAKKTIAGQAERDAKKAAAAAQRDAQPTMRDLLQRPYTNIGMKPEDYVAAFKKDGITAVIEQSTVGSKRAVMIRPDLAGKPRHVDLVEWHPGGGQHKGAYVRLSGTSNGMVHVVNPKTFDPLDITTRVREFIPVNIPVKVVTGK